MSERGRLLWIAGLFAAATVGLLAGIWIGGEIESGIYADILMKADLPAECWDKITGGAESLVDDLKDGEAPAPAQPE